MPPLWIWLRVLDHSFQEDRNRPLTVLDLVRLLRMVQHEHREVMRNDKGDKYGGC